MINWSWFLLNLFHSLHFFLLLNKQHYLNACSETGLKGNFLSNSISEIESFKCDTFDLALCSYALYFFPDYIEQISHYLKKDGILYLSVPVGVERVEFNAHRVFDVKTFYKNIQELILKIE